MNFLLDIKEIEKVIKTISFVKNLVNIQEKDFFINGSFEILFEGLDKELLFRFEIYPSYPLKHQDTESIKFITEELIELNHVMEDGSICIHNIHCDNLKQKLIFDFDSLKQWIEKYYINNARDNNYEHIVVEKSTINNSYYSYLFTQVDYKFEKGSFGLVKYSTLNESIHNEKLIRNYIVKKFEIDEIIINSKWSKFYQANEKEQIGLFYFSNSHPAKYKKFIFKNWLDFQNLLSDDFLNYLHEINKRKLKKNKGQILPIFIGYNTKHNEIYWQVALLKIGEFPLIGEKINFLGNKIWKSKLIDSEIKWALTRDSSYEYFFGRGTLTNKITDKKILIIGVGAIGSIVAKTLTRSGCKYIDIIDYDIKEPENICRSEYMFQFGLNDKVNELQLILYAISPFIEIGILKKEYFESITKTFYRDYEVREYLSKSLDDYDIIFDCSTDNDLMKILDTLKLNCDIINLSITNYARELVCGFYPNIYNFVLKQYETILDNDTENLYEPLGCWSPTFRASYNDIDLLVQFTIKHINILYKDDKQKNNFVIQMNEEKLQLEIKEY